MTSHNQTSLVNIPLAASLNAQQLGLSTVRESFENMTKVKKITKLIAFLKPSTEVRSLNGKNTEDAEKDRPSIVLLVTGVGRAPESGHSSINFRWGQKSPHLVHFSLVYPWMGGMRERPLAVFSDHTTSFFLPSHPWLRPWSGWDRIPIPFLPILPRLLYRLDINDRG